MDYETAKKLQMTLPICNPELGPKDMLNGQFLPRDHKNKNIRLSELIEACGIKFDMLQMFQLDEWYATGQGGWKGAGSTPDEALVNLWLKLNSK